MREINAAGRQLIKRWEGIMDGDPTTTNLNPYLDPVGIWTIGWGHAIRDVNGRYLVGPEMELRANELYPGGITWEQAEQLLTADLLDAARDVQALVKVPLSDNEFAALVSFEFNLGTLGKSTLLRLLNIGDYAGAARQFNSWNKGRVNGVLVPMEGLTRRRMDERRLFQS